MILTIREMNAAVIAINNDKNKHKKTEALKATLLKYINMLLKNKISQIDFPENDPVITFVKNVSKSFEEYKQQFQR